MEARVLSDLLAGCQTSRSLPDPWPVVVVQIDSAHLSILNDSRIQDGHHEEWENEYVAGVVRREVKRLLINTVRCTEFLRQTAPHLQLSSSISAHRTRVCCQKTFWKDCDFHAHVHNLTSQLDIFHSLTAIILVRRSSHSTLPE